MKQHDKISFVREYCLARQIPYKIIREQLFIRENNARWYILFSIYNLTYSDLIRVIDDACIYDDTTTYFERVNIFNLKGW